MFNEAAFQEILLPSSGNINDYTCAYLKEIGGPGRKQNLRIRRSCTM